MDYPQLISVAILVFTIALFLWGRLRHDVVAMIALLACVIFGVVPGEEAFAGFGHPAVVTVACVLILGAGLQSTGAVNALTQHMLPAKAGPTISILSLIALAALLSGFMNNVGALALLMPIAIQIAAKQNLPAGKVLMPLAFGSILGGMTTLIGTPPNLIVSGYRASAGLGHFQMFDFSPVGVVVASCGILFVGLIGWRFVPARKQSDIASFDSGAYISEVTIVAGCKAEKKSLREVEAMLDKADAQIVGMSRSDFRISAPNPRRILLAGDLLVIEVDPESLASALSILGLSLDADRPDKVKKAQAELNANNQREDGEAEAPAKDSAAVAAATDTSHRDEELMIQELVVSPSSALIDRSASDMELRTRYGINLLAISRRGRRSIKRLRHTLIQAGDVLLMQGAPEAISGFCGQNGCLPLAQREVHIPKSRQAIGASSIMALSVLAAATGLLSAAVAFAAGVLAYVVFRIMPLRAIYSAVDWPVVVLLAAMLPVASAMASTGAADVIAQFLLANLAGGNAIAALAMLLVLTMLLSDTMNNAATAAVMCPIALSSAQQLNANPDAFLMTIAVGASCAFLTPIGHQNNTLILGPGGFRFGDYWRLGLGLDLIVIAVSIPMIVLVWPL